MDRYTKLSAILFTVADVCGIVSVTMPDWIVTNKGAPGEVRLGFMWSCMAIYNGPEICYPPELPSSWILALVLICLGCTCLTITIILLAASNWRRFLTPYARWVGLLSIVFFSLASIIFPCGFHIQEIGGRPYHLPLSMKVGTAYVMFTSALWITVVSELCTVKVFFEFRF